MLTFGFNVTPTSSACAVISDDKILDVVVHHFPKAENPDGSSLAANRRNCRLRRRNLKRKKRRKQHIISLITKYFNYTPVFSISEFSNPWKLRAEGLSRLLTKDELAIVLYHIGNRRGFKSTRKELKEAETKTDEGKKKKRMLLAISELKENFLKSKHKTIGSYLNSLDIKRNTDDSYTYTIERDLLDKEITILLNTQRELGNTLITDDFINKYRQIFHWKAVAKDFFDMVGYCTYEPTEKRAAKNSFSAETFVAASRLSHLSALDKKRKVIEISVDDKKKIFELALTQKVIKFSTVRRLLKLPDTHIFNLLHYRVSDALKKEVAKKGKTITWEDIVSDCEGSSRKDSIFIHLTGYHELKDAISSIDTHYWDSIKDNIELLDTLATLISFTGDERVLAEELLKLDIPDKVIDSLLGLEFSKTIDLSLKVVRNLNPHLLNNKTYFESLKLCGYSKKINKESTELKTIPKFESINNPVVNRALSRTRKVLHAAIRKYGYPDNLHIEIARELPKSSEQRRKLLKSMEKNRDVNDYVFKQAAKLFNRNPNYIEFEKYKLWLEQEGISFYSGQPILERHLLDPTMTEIDHIIPFARSYDDSLSNKVLVLINENKNKLKRTPFEMFGQSSLWDSIVDRTNKIKDSNKQKNILVEDFDERTERQWQDRYLNDTRYIAVKIKEHLTACLPEKTSVHIRKPAVITYLKNIWGLSNVLKTRTTDAKGKRVICIDNRRNAIDALIIAACSDDMMRKVSNYNKYKSYQDKEMPKPQLPWSTFVDDVIESATNVLPIRLPIGKTSGCAHAERIMSVRNYKDNKTYDVVKTYPITSLTLKLVEDMVDKDTCNKNLYKLIKDLLLKVAKPKKNGSNELVADAEEAIPNKVIYFNGIPVRKVKCYEKRKRGLFLRKGLAHNKENLKWIDLYSKDIDENKVKYFMRPTYVSQIAKNKLASYCDDGTLVSDLKFAVRLYKDTLVKVKTRTKEDPIVGYFSTINNGSTFILVDPITNERKNISVNTINSVLKIKQDLFQTQI